MIGFALKNLKFSIRSRNFKLAATVCQVLFQVCGDIFVKNRPLHSENLKCKGG